MELVNYATLVVDVRVVEHGFGGNTTDVQARLAESHASLYMRSREEPMD
jgi:hypothetical protein